MVDKLRPISDAVFDRVWAAKLLNKFGPVHTKFLADTFYNGFVAGAVHGAQSAQIEFNKLLDEHQNQGVSDAPERQTTNSN